MFVGIAVAIAVIMAMPKSAKMADPKLPRQADTKWHKVFADEFDGGSLDSAKWVTCYDWYDDAYGGCTNGGNHEQEWYLPGQVKIENSTARLTAVAQPVEGVHKGVVQTYPYRSGMISTGRPKLDKPARWSGLYGYYEARMKVSSGQGVWPAFWLLPVDQSWPPEIDVMEILGDRPKEVLMTNHWAGTDGHPEKDNSVFAGLTDPNGWHVYAMDWRAGKIDWYIDGSLRKSVTSTQVPDKPMELIINLAIGGDLPGKADPATLKGASVEVDYVRVYSSS